MISTTHIICIISFLLTSTALWGVSILPTIHAATDADSTNVVDATIQDDDSIIIRSKPNNVMIDNDKQDERSVVNDDTCAALGDRSDGSTRSDTCSSSTPKDAEKTNALFFFPDCRLYLATSTLAIKSKVSSFTSSSSSSHNILLPSNHKRLGLYTVQPITRGQPIGVPDILIHLVDYPDDLSSFVSLHSFEASQFGAQYEAKTVASILPGIPSVAQSTIMAESNAVPFYARDMDEADVPRTTEPGAGALTHYHNMTFVAVKYLDAGSEIFVGAPNGGGGDDDNTRLKNRRMEWVQQRDEILIKGVSGEQDGERMQIDPRGRRDVEWVREHGICVDHLRVQKSRKKGVGRGAFAVRYIPRGAIVSASPLVPMDRKVAVSVKVKNGKQGRGNKNSSSSSSSSSRSRSSGSSPQLLVNYCLGHVNSTILFYPTAPVVNLINHDRDSANVELRWSTSEDFMQGLNVSSISLEDVMYRLHESDALVMEFVATRVIQPNEEIFMDYGLVWSQAWEKHVQEWKPTPNAISYAPSYVMDDVAGLLRTEKEQVDHPYPSNVMTACFYRYSTHTRNDGIASSNQASPGESTAVQWKMDRRTFDYRNLRPCQIIKREDIDGKMYYSAIMKNWNGMKKDEIIPKHEIHVVESIPRHAIRFVDKLYTTDMHLSNAFRHEIQIPDEIFPCAWKDLDVDKKCE